MRDQECIDFLQWAVPRLHLRWKGFRNLRRQVCKRLGRRMQSLGIDSVYEYRQRLEADPSEWAQLDACCRITISRFRRDRGVFDTLTTVVLPELLAQARARGESTLRLWSVGCASGEEPYSLAMMWELELRDRHPDWGFEVLATDVDATLLQRAARGCYTPGTLKEVPPSWLEQGFRRRGEEYCVREEVRRRVEFVRADLRTTLPAGAFHLILCRNLAFTYFDAALQERTLSRLLQHLVPGGALVIGSHESLPATAQLTMWEGLSHVFKRVEAIGFPA